MLNLASFAKIAQINFQEIYKKFILNILRLKKYTHIKTFSTIQLNKFQLYTTTPFFSPTIPSSLKPKANAILRWHLIHPVFLSGTSFQKKKDF